MLINFNYLNKVFISIAGIFILFLFSQLAFAHGMSEAEKLSIIDGGNLSYLWLGATHMLTGYDHLAFVFGIIFFLTTIRDIAKYVTAFTIGHSITLIYATFNGIQFNYFIIDAIIALSVSYIAFSNIDGFRKYLNVKPPNMLLMILGLGLIHGFGLSTRLQELPLSEDSLLLNIISFNLGIEFGQISALVLMLLLISVWRKRPSFNTFSLVANYSLILMGFLLFLMQMHGYEHSSNAKELSEQRELEISDWKDVIRITIPARGDKEYKFFLKKDAKLEYSWDTKGIELFYDLHADPAGDNSGYFKSFKKNTESLSSGTIIAVFDGSHGWYWKNSNSTDATIILKVKGNYERMDIGDVKEKAAPTKKLNNDSHESIF